MGDNSRIKSSVLFDVSAILISFIFTLIFFLSRDIFRPEPFLYNDHGAYLMELYLIGKDAIGQNNTVFGYSFYIYNGIPVFPFVPIGYVLFMYLFTCFGISYSYSVKISLFLSLFYIGLSPYLLGKKIKYSPLTGILGQVWFWFGINSFWLSRFDTGAISFIITVPLSFLFLFNVIKLNFEEESPKIFSKLWLKMELQLFSILVIHYSSLLLIGLIIAEIILLEYLLSGRITSDLRKKIYFIITLFAWSFVMFSFWLIPMLFIHLPSSSFPTDYWVYSFDTSIYFMGKYLLNNGLIIILIFIIEALLRKRKVMDSTTNSLGYLIRRIRYKKRDVVGENDGKGKDYTFMLIDNLKLLNMLILLTSFFLVFIAPFFKIPYLEGVNSYRFAVFFEYSLCLMVMGIISGLLGRIKRIKKKKSVFGKKGGKDLQRNRIIGHILILFLLFTNGFLMLGEISPNTRTFLGRYYDRDEIIRYDRYFISSRMESFMEFLEVNTTTDSRILFQNTAQRNANILNGYTLPYIAHVSGRYFASGLSSELFFKHCKKSNFMDNVLFGIPLSDYNGSLLEYYLIQYNIEYIVVWSIEAIEFFKNQDCITFIQSKNNLTYFRYDNARRNYIINDNLIVNSFSIQNDLITFTLSNFTKARRVLVSFHDFVNWNIFINGIKVSKLENDLGLIEFYIPDTFRDGDVKIEIIWQVSVIEKISLYFSLIGFIGLIVMGIKRRT